MSIHNDFFITSHQSNIPDVTLLNLSVAVNLTIELADQNGDNINVIRNIFARTAALGQSQIVPEVFNNCLIQLSKHDVSLNLLQTVKNAITILDEIEEWPADMLEQQSNQ